MVLLFVHFSVLKFFCLYSAPKNSKALDRNIKRQKNPKAAKVETRCNPPPLGTNQGFLRTGLCLWTDLTSAPRCDTLSGWQSQLWAGALGRCWAEVPWRSLLSRRQSQPRINRQFPPRDRPRRCRPWASTVSSPALSSRAKISPRMPCRSWRTRSRSKVWCNPSSCVTGMATSN